MTTRLAMAALSLVVIGVSCHLVTGVGDATFEPDGTGGAGGTTASTSTGGASTSTMVTSSSSGGGGVGGATACGHASHSPNGTCPAVCDSCEGSVCNIQCEGNGSLYDCGDRFGDTLTCPVGWDCSVSCRGGAACRWRPQGVNIVCPDGHRCDVDCAGPSACRNLDITCASDGPCGLSCEVADSACRDAELLCGDKDCVQSCDAPPAGNDQPAPLDCSGADCLCDETTCFP